MDELRDAPSLATTLQGALGMLAAAVADRRSPCRTPTLATNVRHGAPSVRTVVLREFDVASRLLVMHTNRRAAKVAELARDARAAVHCYDPGSQTQLRLAGRVSCHVGDAVAVAGWAATPAVARALYGRAVSPGTRVPLPPAFSVGDARAAADFAVLRFRFDRLEWLWLAATGHLRAEFVWTAERLEASWLVP